jgi:hypothetical protein
VPPPPTPRQCRPGASTGISHRGPGGRFRGWLPSLRCTRHGSATPLTSVHAGKVYRGGRPAGASRGHGWRATAWRRSRANHRRRDAYDPLVVAVPRGAGDDHSRRGNGVAAACFPSGDEPTRARGSPPG